VEDQNEKDKRKVHRSPSYPVFALNDAIEKARSIYSGEKRSATTPEVIASHMGYTQANGPGGRAVSALRQFGLLEEAAGKYRISELGFTLIHFERNTTEWRHAAADAIRKPTLFRELLEVYPDDLPSDATLRNDLLKRGFNPGSISDVVSIFRDSISLVGSDASIYDDGVTATAQHSQKDQVNSNRIESLQRDGTEPNKNFVQSQISTPVGTDDGQIVFAHVRFDASIKKEFVSSLKKYLDYLETTLQ
jgi:hypothetical protein